jgi:small subunit ribosomal protein S8
MSLSDPLGDLLTRIRNGQRAKLSVVRSPASKFRCSVLEVLKSEGFIRDYSTRNIRKGIDEIIVELKYQDGLPVIREVARISKPGRRVYSKIQELPRVRNGLGISILSTPVGVMADHDARQKNVGGEVLCRVF